MSTESRSAGGIRACRPSRRSRHRRTGLLSHPSGSTAPAAWPSDAMPAWIQPIGTSAQANTSWKTRNSRTASSSGPRMGCRTTLSIIVCWLDAPRCMKPSQLAHSSRSSARVRRASGARDPRDRKESISQSMWINATVTKSAVTGCGVPLPSPIKSLDRAATLFEYPSTDHRIFVEARARTPAAPQRPPATDDWCLRFGLGPFWPRALRAGNGLILA